MSTSNKATFKRILDATNSHDAELLARTIDEAFLPDAQSPTPLPIGAQAIKEVFLTLYRAYPDLHITVTDMVEEGDKLVSSHTVTGTHQGEYMGLAPTGRSVTYNEIFILRFVDGRIAEARGVVDVLAQMKQLGIIPA